MHTLQCCFPPQRLVLADSAVPHCDGCSPLLVAVLYSCIPRSLAASIDGHAAASALCNATSCDGRASRHTSAHTRSTASVVSAVHQSPHRAALRSTSCSSHTAHTTTTTRAFRMPPPEVCGDSALVPAFSHSSLQRSCSLLNRASMEKTRVLRTSRRTSEAYASNAVRVHARSSE